MFLNIKIFILAILFAFSFFSSADFCEGTFGTKFFSQELARRQGIIDREFHSLFVDPKAEKKLIPIWNEPAMWRGQPLPPLLEVLLPKDAHIIGRQLPFPGTLSAVKMREPGEALMIRTYHDYIDHNPVTGSYKKYRIGNNVAISERALVDNMRNLEGDNWLVSRNAPAVALYLHGGGTTTTGSNSGVSVINNLHKYYVDVVSVDLAHHGQGHREFFNFESEIKNLSAFAKKYIPPNVPLFVWGHSWGGTVADKIMTMTDRSDFSFHDNLQGVIIMSTAVDSAPGRTPAEKFTAFITRLHKAKETSELLGNEKERTIYRDMIVKGKINPLGNMVSSSTILQSEHSIPPHGGKLYIPGLVAVGKHDTLVYTEWSDLYHQRYDNLANIPPAHRHFIEDGLVEVENNKFERVPMGHLIGGYRSPPKGRETGAIGERFERKEVGGLIQYNIALSFMEQQLRLNPIRQVILEAARLGETQDGVEVNETTKKRIKYLPSFEAAREYVTTEMPNVPQETKDQIMHQIQAVQSSKPLLSKVDTTHVQEPFVDVVKYAANDLGFRDFLIDYRHVAQNTNQKYRNVNQNLPVLNEIRTLLNPFSTPLKRALHVIRELSAEEPSYDYVTLRAELDLVIKLGESENSSISAQLLKDLKLLKSVVDILPNDRNVIRKDAKRIYDGHQNIFRNITIDGVPKKVKRGEIISFVTDRESSLEDVENILKGVVVERFRDGLEEKIKDEAKKRIKDNIDKGYRAETERELTGEEIERIKGEVEKKLKELAEIPEAVRKEVLELKETLITSYDIATGIYLPNMKELAPLVAGRSNRTKGRVREVLSLIKEEVIKRIQTQYLLAADKKSLEEKVKRRDVLMERVVQAIKIVRSGLERIKDKDKEPPISVAAAVRESEAELDRLVEAQDKMEDELTKYAAEMFVREDLHSESGIIEGYNSGYRGYVDNYMHLYHEYVQNRKSLDRETLIAMKNGEMGEESKQAVIDLYGMNFEGTRINEGKYIELIEVIHGIAQLEKSLKDAVKKLIKVSQDYDNRMQQLVNLLATKRSTGADPMVVEGELKSDTEVVSSDIPQNHPILIRLRSAMDLYTYEDTLMVDVLNGARDVVLKQSDSETSRNIIENFFINNNGNIRKIDGNETSGSEKDMQSAKAELVEYIDNHRDIFIAVLSDWKKAFKAELPPEIPLIPLEEIIINE